MKKLFLLVIIFISITLSSCEILSLYDISLRNNCGFQIQVSLEKYQTTAPDYLTIIQNGTRSYTDLNYGTHYLYIRKPGEATFFMKEMEVDRNETWVITPDGTGYAVTAQL